MTISSKRVHCRSKMHKGQAKNTLPDLTKAPAKSNDAIALAVMEKMVELQG
jgi:chaperone required for assembly of F1-ATPase